MFRLAAIVALLSCVYAGPAHRGLNGRIVGGTNTTIEQHPYQVSLQNRTGFHFCGGSLINEKYIVTAAHCLKFKKPASIQVRVGSTYYNNGGLLIDIESFKLHEEFKIYTMNYDIAVMKLKTPVQETSAIGFIELPTSQIESGAEAIVTGWGTTSYGGSESPDKLLKVSVKMIDQKTCASNKYDYGQRIKGTMICAAEVNSDACQGDSGGPLVSDGYLVGVVSWGNGCALEDYPGVYTDVVQFYDWIEKTVAKL